MPPRITVVGSINVDVVTRGDRPAGPGETRRGSGFAVTLGGKGANQAVAASKLGADVVLVGRVGDDVFGQYARDTLAEFGLDLSGIDVVPGVPTGTASIFVDSHGQNAITIVAGANDALAADVVARHAQRLMQTDVLLLQCEVPDAANLAAARIVKQGGGIVILDPAPVPDGGIPSDLLQWVDFITPNETEAAALAGDSASAADSPAALAARLRQGGMHAVVLKRGADGALLATDAETHEFPAFSVQVVDTVAAGDSFNAGLAVALGERIGLAPALRMASACGALATTKAGAAVAAPARLAVEELLRTASSR